jgi:hypothetical protein
MHSHPFAQNGRRIGQKDTAPKQSPHTEVRFNLMWRLYRIDSLEFAANSLPGVTPWRDEDSRLDRTPCWHCHNNRHNA